MTTFFAQIGFRPFFHPFHQEHFSFVIIVFLVFLLLLLSIYFLIRLFSRVLSRRAALFSVGCRRVSPPFSATLLPQAAYSCVFFLLSNIVLLKKIICFDELISINKLTCGSGDLKEQIEHSRQLIIIIIHIPLCLQY